MKINQLLESLNQQQRSVPQLPAQAKARHISVLGAKTDPKHPFAGYMVGADESAEPGKKSIGPDRNDPWEKGWRAGFRHNESNPYPAGSKEAQQWDDGYAEAESQPRHYDEGRAGVDDTDTVGFSVNTEAAYTAVMKRFGDVIDHDETSGVMYAPARVWPQIEMVAFDADGEGATRDDGIAEQGVAEATGDTSFDSMMGNIVKGARYKGAAADQRADAAYGDMMNNITKNAADVAKPSADSKFEQVYSAVERILLSNNVHWDIDDDISDALKKLKIKASDALMQKLERELTNRVSDALQYYDDSDLAEQGVAEATSDPKFDKMLKGITGKKAVAKQQKTDTKQQSRDAFGSMFGGTSADLLKNLKIREQGVAEEQLDEKCWDGYEKKGMKTMFGKRVPNCVKNEGAERNEMDTAAVQAALARMAERHKGEKWSKEQLAALGKRIAARGQKPVKEDDVADFLARGGKITQVKPNRGPRNPGLSLGSRHIGGGGDGARASRTGRGSKPQGKPVVAVESITKEDIITKLKARLGDYLSDIGKEIKKDPDLIDKLAAKAPGDQMGPPVKTVTTDDGHEIQIHGNEDDGFRISIKNKPAASKFKNLDEAVMACEMYCARRRSSQDYLDEAGKDACYSKVKSRYKIWPSAYASGALVKCRKVGAANWGNKSKK